MIYADSPIINAARKQAAAEARSMGMQLSEAIQYLQDGKKRTIHAENGTMSCDFFEPQTRKDFPQTIRLMRLRDAERNFMQHAGEPQEPFALNDNEPNASKPYKQQTPRQTLSTAYRSIDPSIGDWQIHDAISRLEQQLQRHHSAAFRS